MLKNFTLLVFMFLMLASYGQKSTLLQNINFRAKELKHSLNERGDSLILQSEKTIYSVEIFNQDYEKVVEVGGNETTIPLNGTPTGRLVVQAKMIDKRILMTLLRHDPIEEISNSPKPKQRLTATYASVIEAHSIHKNTSDDYSKIESKAIFDFKPIAKLIKEESKITSLDEDSSEIMLANDTESTISKTNKDKPRTSLSGMLNWKPKKDRKSDKIFWVSYIINSGTSSRKIMKMVNHLEADKIITKYKVENKTKEGKDNQLTIWEVYDSAKFMEQQIKNPEYINSITSNLFNVKPYYNSSNTNILNRDLAALQVSSKQ